MTDNVANTVNICPPGSTTPSKKLTSGYTGPQAISIDQKGIAVVANNAAPIAVFEYKPGTYKPYAKLANGISQALSLLLAKP